jgi:NAD(P)-dependent dehydrogenase (short-subunit alcohol dehydrogenase family)
MLRIFSHVCRDVKLPQLVFITYRVALVNAIRDVSDAPLTELLALPGRVAVVTGGARGIGFACCARLAEAGAAVLVADVDEGAAAEAAARIGPSADAAWVDVREAESLRDLADRALADLGRLDVWVNCAGIFPASPLLELSEDDWDRVVEVNLRGTFIGAREAARAMIAAAQGGVIVNIASTAAYRADGPGVAHYVSSKFGVRGLTQSLAVELGGHGIRVLAVAPTVTLTPGLEAERAPLEAAGFALDELGPRLPLGRVAVPDDVARVVVFCASDLSLLMTGSTLLVDAGELA